MPPRPSIASLSATLAPDPLSSSCTRHRRIDEIARRTLWYLHAFPMEFDAAGETYFPPAPLSASPWPSASPNPLEVLSSVAKRVLHPKLKVTATPHLSSRLPHLRLDANLGANQTGEFALMPWFPS
jgi:hypothetical protein